MKALREQIPTVGSAKRVAFSRNSLVIALMLALLVVLVGWSAASGQVYIPPAEVFGSVMHHMGLDIGPMPSSPNGEETLWTVRFPRIVMGLLVGATLACAGCLLQGVLANPLAEPGVIGVSAGAAVGACLAIVSGGIWASVWGLAGAAFISALITVAVVYTLSMRDGSSSPIMLILIGIAVNAFASGIIAFLTFLADTNDREQIVFWQLGSLQGVGWRPVWVVLPVATAAIAVSLLLVRRLDLLSLGEIQAAALGVRVETVRRIAILLVAVLTAAAVAFTGIVMFVGLVVPHLMRLIVGPRHVILLPASVIGGAIVVCAADLGARTLMTGADLPLGMLTSLIGGPVFFLLLRRSRHTGVGW
ncbi:iron complex transport system permease protein [Williamsia muralis]|uniref:Iron complex transport system permease protein n=2 Tax=Williamsia marianensis TaxID=85044 RepID=A0A495K5I6_WILMA|nr:iron complex transport system permease protein [Williamsia muralis]